MFRYLVFAMAAISAGAFLYDVASAAYFVTELIAGDFPTSFAFSEAQLEAIQALAQQESR